MQKAEENLPEEFLRNMKVQLGQEYELFISSMEDTVPVSVRLNPKKPIQQFLDNEIVPWCATGRYLPVRPSFTFDPLFHAGAYYVQEASSMFIEQAWKKINPDNRNMLVLDLCAAPGGKSTHLLSLMNEQSTLVANEVIPNRNAILRENLTKWGYANTIVTQSDTAQWETLGEYFDLILVDAPCSGEGLFRKDENAVDHWSLNNVTKCCARQSEILDRIVNVLKPGGFIIYSTCTYEYDENDFQVARLMERNEIKSVAINFEGITNTKHGVQFFPHKNKGEGFYMALLQKGNASLSDHSPSQKTISSSPALEIIGKKYLKNIENFVLLKRSEMLFAIPKHSFADYQLIQHKVTVKQSGIFLGEYKNNDFLPAHSLALSTHLNENIPRIPLNEDQAVSYLKCESIKPNTELRGWCVVTYQDKALGWIKMMDQRANNYFPREWRILKDKR